MRKTLTESREMRIRDDIVLLGERFASELTVEEIMARKAACRN